MHPFFKARNDFNSQLAGTPQPQQNKDDWFQQAVRQGLYQAPEHIVGAKAKQQRFERAAREWQRRGAHIAALEQENAHLRAQHKQAFELMNQIKSSEAFKNVSTNHQSPNTGTDSRNRSVSFQPEQHEDSGGPN